jgi:ABC-type uncharacterized transport system substrate-binding protein
MKILIIPDVPHWAIGKLSKSIKTYNPDLDIDIHYVHPRDAEEPETLAQLKKKLDEFKPDVVHFQYWNTAQKLIKAGARIKRVKNYTYSS